MNNDMAREALTHPDHPDIAKLPLIKEIRGQRRIVQVWSDLDGTANDDTIPEGKRMDTIGPAREAFAKLESLGVTVGLISARGAGEVEAYQKALGVTGPIIAEDGQVIIFPTGITLKSEDLPPEFSKYRLTQHSGNQALLLSAIDTDALREFAQLVLEEANKKGLAKPEDIYSSLTKEPEKLIKSTGHQSLDFVRRSVDRLGSGYFDKISPEFLELLRDLAPQYGIRIVGDTKSASIYGADSNKGTALRVFDQLAPYFFPNHKNVTGMVPIVFGNERNDLPMFEAVHKMGGLAIMVGNDVNPDEIPEYVKKIDKPHGYGIQESLPEVEQWLAA